MQFETVLYEKEEDILWIKLNRPQVLNALNYQLATDVVSALREARKDFGVRAVILKGEGRAFCAGGDVKDAAVPKSYDQRLQHRQNLTDIGRGMEDLGKPIIAAIHGYCMGAGFECAIACDIRIAAENAQFGLPEASLGAPITSGGLQNLPQLIGLGRAKELVYTSKRIDAQEAYRIGLVNKVVPVEELDKTTRALAKEITKNNTAMIRLMKGVMDHSFETSKESVYFLDWVINEISYITGSRDAGFAAKREEISIKNKGPEGK